MRPDSTWGPSWPARSSRRCRTTTSTSSCPSLTPPGRRRSSVHISSMCPSARASSRTATSREHSLCRYMKKYLFVFGIYLNCIYEQHNLIYNCCSLLCFRRVKKRVERVYGSSSTPYAASSKEETFS